MALADSWFPFIEHTVTQPMLTAIIQNRIYFIHSMLENIRKGAHHTPPVADGLVQWEPGSFVFKICTISLTDNEYMVIYSYIHEIFGYMVRIMIVQTNPETQAARAILIAGSHLTIARCIASGVWTHPLCAPTVTDDSIFDLLQHENIQAKLTVTVINCLWKVTHQAMGLSFVMEAVTKPV